MGRKRDETRWKPTGFGAILRELRVTRGLTQQNLATAAGCHLITVSKIERGTQEPAWPLVLAFAEALGVDVNVFVPKPDPTAES